MHKKNYTVVYIAGNGHSGSTLLDIILGNGENCFSVGELSFIIRDGLEEEYCSCNIQIKSCEFWTEVFDLWSKSRISDFKQYKRSRHKYERNATFLRTLMNSIFPTREFKVYKINTELLFDAIHKVSGANVIIDSSKSPQRIAVLRGNLNIKVIHLCREFKGVLNSAKHAMKKDIKKGIEADSNARRTSKTLVDWVLTNLLCSIFKIGVPTKKLKYKDYIQKPEKFKEFHPAFAKIVNQHSFSAEHMIAGNHIRLKKDIKIDPNLGFSYNRLSKRQLTLATWVDRIFWFWH